jgi:hypothetical protein
MKSAGLAAAFLAMALAGCASMSKDECLTVDWRTVGYEDGAAGRSGEAIGQRRKACAAAGVRPDLDAYRAGRADGLREYCQPENGYRVGAAGGVYGGFCPADLASAFSQAYETGRELHLREYRVRQADERLAAMRRELDGVEHRMTEAGFNAISPTSTSEQRAQALLETEQLAQRHERLATDIDQLERDRRRCEQELQDYRTQLAYAH